MVNGVVGWLLGLGVRGELTEGLSSVYFSASATTDNLGLYGVPLPFVEGVCCSSSEYLLSPVFVAIKIQILVYSVIIKWKCGLLCNLDCCVITCNIWCKFFF